MKNLRRSRAEIAQQPRFSPTDSAEEANNDAIYTYGRQGEVRFVVARIKKPIIGQGQMTAAAYERVERMGRKAYRDRAGHVIASMLGGEGKPYNAFPVDAEANNRNMKSVELRARNLVNQHGEACLILFFDYDRLVQKLRKDRPTRPTAILYSVWANGEFRIMERVYNEDPRTREGGVDDLLK